MLLYLYVLLCRVLSIVLLYVSSVLILLFPIDVLHEPLSWAKSRYMGIIVLY